jgi:tetratricopeptide (TPR) repeat protein
MSAGRVHLLRLALLLAATGGVYLSSLDNSFHFDDEHSLLGNPHIRRLENWPRFFTDPQTFSRNPGSEMYRPLVLFSYALNYRVGRYQVRGYHLANLGIHLATAGVLYAVLVVLQMPAVPALLGCLWFGVHPLTAEPVNYISSRSESLAALFCLAGFLLQARSPGKFSPVALLCYAGGLLSKPVAAGLPLLLLAYEWTWQPARVRHCWRWHWPYWVLLAGYLGLTERLIHKAVVQAPVREWGAQLCTQAKALIYYLKLAVLPRPLTVEHQFAVSDSPLAPVVLGSLVFLGSVAALLVHSARTDRRPVFWSAWAVAALAPTLVVPLNVLVAERRLYLALAGGVGLLLWSLCHQRRSGRWLVLAGVWLGLLAVTTIQYNRAWESPASLWSWALQRAPQMVRPHLRMGGVLRQAGQWDEAEAEYRAALVLDPHNAPAYNNLGNLYHATHRYAEAAQAFAKALELLPQYPEALSNLATLRADQGQYDEALALFERALPLSPNRGEIYNNLGTTLLKMGRYAQAERTLSQALALDPEPGVYFNLGGAFEGQGRDAEAVHAYAQAIRLDPGYAKPYYHLGLLHEAAGRTTEASQAYEGFLSRWSGDALPAAQVRQRLERLRGGR